MSYDTPEQLWDAVSAAAKETEATGKAAPLAEPFAGALVALVSLASPLAARVQAAIAAEDGTGLLPPTPPTCSSCRFWRASDRRCQVRAPEVFYPLGTTWPETTATDWCGQWGAIT